MEYMKIDIIKGVEGNSVCINEYRVAGPKPWGGGEIVESWKVNVDDILRAIGRYDELKGGNK